HPADHPLALAQAPGQTRGWRLRRVEALRFNGPAVGAGDQSIQAIIVAIGDSPEAPVAPGEPRQVAARHTLDRMLGQQLQLLESVRPRHAGQQQAGQQNEANQATTSARLPLASSQLLRSLARFLASSMSITCRVLSK